MSALTHWLALQGFPGRQARHSNGDTPLMRAAWQGQDAIVLAYHQRTKHRLDRYAVGPETLDWDAQPDPFRRFAGAPLVSLALPADHDKTAWTQLFSPGAVAPHAPDLDSLGLLFELSFALSAWKEFGPDRWAQRCNPSSGNLHPTEVYLLARGLADLNDGLYHYAPKEHGLEQRACFAGASASAPAPRLLVGFSSIHWREAWKYGERAFRYCQLDMGHAIGALRYAAAVLGWRLREVALTHAETAALLGLDRAGDFASAEREEPETVFELLLSPESSATEPAADLIRSRRSAQRFDRRARLEADKFWPIMAALMPQTPQGQTTLPWDALSAPAAVHAVLFAHRIDGLAPGAYLFPRHASALPALQTAMPHLAWTPAPGHPADVPLYELTQNPALAGTVRTLSCHQAIGADALFVVALLAQFDETFEQAPWRYRALLQEAGLIGQALYLEAEAAGLRGTGIGCYFDDAMHELLGLRGPLPDAPAGSWQVLYHFSVGLPLPDTRITSSPPYDKENRP